MKIIDLLTKQAELTTQLSKANAEIDQCYLEYHKRLIDAGFYNHYTLNGGELLEKIFWIRPYALPYSDQGEGDYASVEFIINGNNLDLEYQVTWQRNAGTHLLSIPLNIIEGDVLEFSNWLLPVIEEQQSKIKQKRAEQDEAKRKQDIANLKLQLKNLGA